MEREKVLFFTFKSEEGASQHIDDLAFDNFLAQYQDKGFIEDIEYEVIINDEKYVAHCSSSIVHYTEDDCDYDMDGEPILWNVGYTTITYKKLEE